MIKFISIVLMMLALTACSSVPTAIEIDTKPSQRPALIVPTVDEFNARELEWITITPENINSVWADLQESGEEVVLIAVTPQGIRNLTLNMADLLKLVQQQKKIIISYQNYYETDQP